VSVRITEAGIFDTFQDTGRYGFASLGINPGGVMDACAANTANYLAANDQHEAVIELHYPASSFYFEADALVAITGADFSPCVNDQPVPINTPLIIKAGCRLDFTKMKSGMRSYLAVNGGFLLNKWLNSYSTNIKAKAGGWNGRSLRKDDMIPLQPFASESGTNVPLSFGNRQEEILENKNSIPVMRTKGLGVRSLPWHVDVATFYKNDNLIRITRGRECELLTDCSETIIEGNTFSISMQSDRMGYRMNGSPLKLGIEKDMISSAVTRGTVQLLPNGQLIILMADHQTTGGYPRLGHVITADMPTLSQLRPNTSIRFSIVTLEEAENLLLEQEHHLQQIKSACHFRLQQYLHEHAIDRP
jgi:antagonist of KipI